MNKLYWIVCDDKNQNIFEGRYQGRTRGEAMKFLKQSLGRKSLNGLVFTITEIPVPLIREIVAGMLAGGPQVAPIAAVIPFQTSHEEEPPVRFDAFANQPAASSNEEPEAPAPTVKAQGKVGNPGLGDERWAGVRAFWQECRSIKQTAEHFGLSPNSIKTRARRDGWGK